MPPQESSWSEVAHQRLTEKKTHVTFPQLKYPSLRDEGPRDAIQWLAGKAMDDGAEGLWRIGDKLYDITQFIDSHPGGPEWLELTKGTDITEAFESHHLSPSIEKMLEKYYMREANTPRNSPFTFKDDGFYRTLKREAYKELKKIPKDANKSANRITDGLFFTLLVSCVAACSVTDVWAAQFWYLISSITLALLTVACHNYIHRKNFRVSHVISHHLYTNTLMDLEISSLEPLLLYNPRKDKPLYAKLGFITEFFIFPALFLLAFFKRFSSIFYRKNFLKQHYRWHDGIALLLPIFMYAVSGSSLSHAIYTWLWINCTGSLIFFCIGVNAAHHHPDAIKDGDQPRSETPDWGVHQVEALLDRKDVNSNTFAVLTLFGDHTLHHMFPTLDHGLLKYLYPTFLKLCEKFQANYRMSTQFNMVIGQLKEIMRTEFKENKK